MDTRKTPNGRELTLCVGQGENWRSPRPPERGGRGAITQRSYLDLHSHSTDASDDAGGTVEGYLKWIVARRRKGYQVDGFVLTEHRQFDPSVDYSALAGQYGVAVLRGAELETDVGHVLVYGVTPRFADAFDFADIALPYGEIFSAAKEFGGFAVAAHAGRPRIGLADHVAERGVSLDAVEAIEQLNGGSNDAENATAARLAEEARAALRRRQRRPLRERHRPLPDRVQPSGDLDRGAGGGAARWRLLSGDRGRDQGRASAGRQGRGTQLTSETGSEVQFEYDESVIGVDVELSSLDVTAEMIADYCEALGETNPLYMDAEAAAAGPHGGIIAPPGLLSALSFGGGGLDPKVKFGNTTFFAGSRLEIFEPIRSGRRHHRYHPGEGGLPEDRSQRDDGVRGKPHHLHQPARPAGGGDGAVAGSPGGMNGGSALL